MDECGESIEMMSFLACIQAHWHVSVLVTCRDPVDKYQGSTAALPDIICYTLEEKDSKHFVSQVSDA